MMNTKKLLTFIPLVFICFAFAQQDGLRDLIQPGAELEKLSGEFSFTEGPVADHEGNVFFTDQPNDRIMKWDISGELVTFLSPSGRANGLAIDNEGYLWVCADEKNEVRRVSPEGESEVIITGYEGKLLNGPNDIWVTPDGKVYFTDPYYVRTWWDHDTQPQEIQGVYYYDPDNKSLSRVVDDLAQPNGIVGTPDGNSLYIADIRERKTWLYDISSDGSLVNKRLFCEMGSDGITLDSEGNLYLTGRGVTIVNRNGERVGNIDIPGWTANVCFGDPDNKSLFITSGEGFYRMRMNVSGNKR